MRAFSLLIILTIQMLAATPIAVSQFQIEISLGKESVTLLEAVPLDVVFRNGGNTDLKIDLQMFEKEDIGWFSVIRPDKSILEISQVVLRTPASEADRVKTLAPGEQVTVSVLLCCDYSKEEGSIFTQTGEYRVAVQYNDGTVSSRSDTVRISIVQPPDQERRALKMVRELRYPNALYEPDMISFHISESLAELERLAGVQESDVYAAYAKTALAWWYIHTGVTDKSKITAEDWPKAIVLAETMLNGIKADEFTMAQRVADLRRQIESVKAKRQ